MKASPDPSMGWRLIKRTWNGKWSTVSALGWIGPCRRSVQKYLCHGDFESLIFSYAYLGWVDVLGQGSQTFFCKGPESKYFRPDEWYGLFCNCSALLLLHASRHRPYINEWLWLCPNKPLFTTWFQVIVSQMSDSSVATAVIYCHDTTSPWVASVLLFI